MLQRFCYKSLCILITLNADTFFVDAAQIIKPRRSEVVSEVVDVAVKLLQLQLPRRKYRLPRFASHALDNSVQRTAM